MVTKTSYSVIWYLNSTHLGEKRKTSYAGYMPRHRKQKTKRTVAKSLGFAEAFNQKMSMEICRRELKSVIDTEG